jgi:hypothetical protein
MKMITEHIQETETDQEVNKNNPRFSCKFSIQNHYLLTQLSPSWGAANCAAPQELPNILWNSKVKYRVHKNPPLVPIVSHINPIHSIPSYHSKIHFNIVPLPTSWSSQWSLSFWLSHQYPIRIPLQNNYRFLQLCSDLPRFIWNETFLSQLRNSKNSPMYKIGTEEFDARLSNWWHVGRLRPASWFSVVSECTLPAPNICINISFPFVGGGANLFEEKNITRSSY